MSEHTHILEVCCASPGPNLCLLVHCTAHQFQHSMSIKHALFTESSQISGTSCAPPPSCWPQLVCTEVPPAVSLLTALSLRSSSRLSPYLGYSLPLHFNPAHSQMKMENEGKSLPINIFWAIFGGLTHIWVTHSNLSKPHSPHMHFTPTLLSNKKERRNYFL